MKKERKTTIWLECRYTQFYTQTYSQKTAIRTIVRDAVMFHIDTRCTDIYYQIYVDDVLQSAPFDEDLDPSMPRGFNHTALFYPNIGNTIRVLAYRVPNAIDQANYIGFVEGVLTEQGYVISSQENVDVKNEFEKRSVRV